MAPFYDERATECGSCRQGSRGNKDYLIAACPVEHKSRHVSKNASSKKMHRVYHSSEEPYLPEAVKPPDKQGRGRGAVMRWVKPKRRANTYSDGTFLYCRMNR